MNRPRKSSESLKVYHQSERDSEWEIKRKLKGRLVWPASRGTYDPENKVAKRHQEYANSRAVNN